MSTIWIFPGSYDVVLACDLIEHLTPAELDRLYSCISSHLSPRGIFVVHTFPNAWYYRYGHAWRLRRARDLDAYLPLEPRSRYEQLMHINEQSPRVLRRQLRAHFPHVLLWFAAHDLTSPFENLKRRFSKNEMRDAGDLFAVASRGPVAVNTLCDVMTMLFITPPVDLLLVLLEIPSTVRRGSRFTARVRPTNNSGVNLRSRMPYPVHLSYHCYSEAQQVVTFDGLRTAIPTVKAGSFEEIEMQLAVPSGQGRFLFRLTVVQEAVTWFDESPQNVYVEKWLEVV
jgi:hypothetical protein